MTTYHAHDGALKELECLTPLALDPARAEGVRLRCRVRIARRARRAERMETVFGSVHRLFVPALLGVFSALYVVALLATTLRLEGFIR